MIAAQQDAQRLARSAWPEHLSDSTADEILDGYAWYRATGEVEHLFDVTFFRTAHSVASRPYFGGHVIWSFPTLRLSRHVVASRDRYGAAFESLDRWLGTPTLQSAMFEVAHLPADRLTADIIVKTLSNAAGQDVSWAFGDAAIDVDYAVDAISDKSVTVSRRGIAAIPRNAMMLKVVFADGEPVLVNWDGREASHTFQFSGPSKIVAANLDPDRIIAFDRNHLNNSIVPSQPTNVPVRKWAARWIVWLQHTMLSYGFLA